MIDESKTDAEKEAASAEYEAALARKGEIETKIGILTEQKGLIDADLNEQETRLTDAKDFLKTK
jgi:hypothetical protein